MLLEGGNAADFRKRVEVAVCAGSGEMSQQLEMRRKSSWFLQAMTGLRVIFIL